MGWSFQGGAASSAPPSGAAGGDLTGTYPSPDIASGVIVDADVNASAAVRFSKLSAPERLWRPTGVLAETFPRRGSAFSNSAAINSGTLYVAGGMVLEAGVTYTNISLATGGGAGATSPTNQWFC